MIGRRSFIASLTAGAAASALGAGGRIRVGQVGTQHSHAAGKMEAVRKLSDLYEVVGISSAKPPSGKSYEGLRQLSEDALLSEPGLNAVLIETGIEEAPGAALRALRAGMHVHLDKPGGLEHGAFKHMRLEAHQRGLTVQMGYMLRYNPAFQLLFQALREGWLGDILEIDAMMGKLADSEIRKSIGALPGEAWLSWPATR